MTFDVFHFGRFAIRKTAFVLPPEHRSPDGTNIPCNPSEAVHPVHGLVRAVRLVNYVLVPNTTCSVRAVDGGQVFKSRTLITVDDKVRLEIPTELRWPVFLDQKRRNDAGQTVLERVQANNWGVEDVRLFVRRDGRLYGIGACYVTPRAFGRPSQVLLSFSADLTEFYVGELSSVGTQDEKNWLHHEPLGEDPWLRYWSDGWRGSAAPIPYRGGYLAMLHRKTAFEGRWAYTHAFVMLGNAEHGPIFSREFIIDTKDGGVEFAMSLRRDGQDFCVAYGYEDREARFAWFKEAAIQMLFEN